MTDRHLYLIGVMCWILAIVSLLTYPTHTSSYAKGFQVNHHAKMWRV